MIITIRNTVFLGLFIFTTALEHAEDKVEQRDAGSVFSVMEAVGARKNASIGVVLQDFCISPLRLPTKSSYGKPLAVVLSEKWVLLPNTLQNFA